MRSLFAKFLLWFLAAMAITMAGFMILTTRSFTAARGRGHIFGRMLSAQLEEARHAFEQGGRPALASFLQRFDSEFPAHGILTDAAYHDLVTGQDRRDLVEDAERRGRLFQPTVIARASRPTSSCRREPTRAARSPFPKRSTAFCRLRSGDVRCSASR